MKKLFTPGQVGIGTFFGGPLAALYYIKSNFRAMSEPGKADLATILWVGFYLLILSAYRYAPEYLLEWLPDCFCLFFTPYGV